MLFSILVPVYNAQNSLERCVQSILNQTEQDFEIILVDDGSTDGSSMLCDALASQHPGKISVIHQENKGLLMARRIAFSVAQGEYLICVDSDDDISHQLLEILLRYFRQGADMVAYNYAVMSEDDTVLQQEPIFSTEQWFSGDEKKKLYYILMTSWGFNALWAKAYKKTLVDIDNSYAEYAQVKYGEDLLQVFPILTAAAKVAYTPEPLYHYRMSVNGMTRRYKKHYYEDMRTVFLVMEHYVSLWGTEDAVPQMHTHELCVVDELFSLFLLKDCPLSIRQKCRAMKAISEDSYFKVAFQTAADTPSRHITWIYHKKSLRIYVYFVLHNLWHRLR
ncbi:MAG: glycosyltransferase family 2 protein [Ruthenibacterium sp.]